MKQSQYVVHNRGLSQILFATPWSVRSIFKHVLVASFIAFITIIAFDFNTFKDSIEAAVNGPHTASITETAKLGAPQMIWDVLLIFLEIRLLRRSLKMLQTSNKNMWVFIPFALIAIGLGAFIALFFPGWMEDILVLEMDFIGKFEQLTVFVYLYMMIPVLTIIWSIANAFNERRVSPFVARANILTSINMCLWLTTIGCGAAIAQLLFLGDVTTPFDIHSPLQIFLILMEILLVVATIGTSLWSQRDMRIKTNYKFFDKNIDQAISVAVVVPIAIWLCSSFFKMNGNWMEYLFIAIIAAVSIFCIAFEFIKRTEIGSPRVFMVVISLMLTIVWIAKFFFEYFWNFNVQSAFSLPISVVATAIIISVIYWKSPMTSRPIRILFNSFIRALLIVVVGSWAVSLVPFIVTFFPVVNETFNILSIALPIALLSVSMIYWYITQWRIKSHITYKERKNKKKKDTKEAANA